MIIKPRPQRVLDTLHVLGSDSPEKVRQRSIDDSLEEKKNESVLRTNQFGGRCVVAQRCGILRTGVEWTGASS